MSLSRKIISEINVAEMILRSPGHNLVTYSISHINNYKIIVMEKDYSLHPDEL